MALVRATVLLTIGQMVSSVATVMQIEMSELQSLTQLAQFVLPDFSCNLHLQQHELLLARPSIGQMVSSVVPVIQIVISVLEEIIQIAQFVIPDFTCNL